MDGSFRKSLWALGFVAVLVGSAGAGYAQNVEKGAGVFRQCLGCHKLEPGKNGIGPSLAGVFGNPAGRVAGYTYSSAHLKKAAEGLVWTDANLRKYLTKPHAVVPDNKMPFPGLKNPQDIEDLIAYVKDSDKKHATAAHPVATDPGMAQKLERGAGLFRQCVGCHRLEPGKNAVGPSLAGVFGGPAGKVAGYQYSAAHLKKAGEGLVWTDDNLRKYLAEPHAVVPENKMAFPGLKNAQDVDALIAYVKANGGQHK